MSQAASPVSCLFVHGWGMNRRVWQPLMDSLPEWIDCHAIDLPGHGRRHAESLTDLHALAEDLQQHCAQFKVHDRPLLLVGWSLGALACVQAAAQKETPLQADGLLLVSSNPCFVAQSGWPHGVDAAVFDQFAESLASDFSGTIRRFLSLQVKGSVSGRQILRELREMILQETEPDAASLQAGLQILKQSDLRAELAQINLPVSWALGGQDGLVKASLAGALSQLMPEAAVECYATAGHAPFLSHSDAFARQLMAFIQSCIVRPAD
ncbi:MAG TPA: pimeloyl-ACP methyl ester esterase BioH [Gammaproteobacteria bacterium]